MLQTGLVQGKAHSVLGARGRGARRAACGLGVAATLLFAGSAHAASFEVDSLGDASDATVGDTICATAGPPAVCTLRAAIEESESTGALDTITFAATLANPATINLTGALPEIEEDLTITGPGPRALTVRRNTGGNYRVFTTDDDVSISGMTITNGLDDGASSNTGSGGGIFNDGRLTLDNVVVTANTASKTTAGTGNAFAVGGGIANSDTLTVTNSTISNNTASATVTVDEGRAIGGGVGSVLIAGVTISRSTISGNTASATEADDPLAIGGGIGLFVSAGRLTNVTVSGNRATATGSSPGEQGGGVASFTSLLAITSSTIAFNEATTGANLAVGALSAASVRNTIISNPVGGANCAELPGGAISSSRFNLASDASCDLTDTGDQQGVDPLLGPLADNGGPTATHAPAITSPAVDQGLSASTTGHPAVPDDQRGRTRPVDLGVANHPDGDGADIGAFERQEYEGGVLFDSPVGYWRMGESSGLAMLDSSGNGNHGAYQGGVLLGQAGALANDPDTAASFDGINDFGLTPDSNSLDVGDSFTIEGWIKRSNTTKTHQLFNKGRNGFQLVVMNAGAGSQVYLRKTDVSTIARSAVAVPADEQYHHIVATKNGTDVHIYVDGIESTFPVSLAQVVQNTAFNLLFGTSASNQANFDEFALYDGVLSAAQVADHYAAGAPATE